MYDANGKVVFVTGGAAGIGAGIVRAFLKEGAKHVSALDVNVSSGIALEKELTNEYGANKIKFHKCDVTTDELDAAYDNVLENFGNIDVVVNCAGIMNDKPNAFMKEIEVNVSALIKSSLRAFNIMRKDRNGRGGTIINISSIVALYQSRVFPVYAATKSAVLQFSNCLGLETHYTRSGARVITLCFGCTETSLFSSSKMGTFDEDTEELLQFGLPNLSFQKPESAVEGLLHAFKHGKSASTWLVISNKPAEDITENISKAYQIMSQGVFEN